MQNDNGRGETGMTRLTRRQEMSRERAQRAIDRLKRNNAKAQSLTHLARSCGVTLHTIKRILDELGIEPGDVAEGR